MDQAYRNQKRKEDILGCLSFTGAVVITLAVAVFSLAIMSRSICYASAGNMGLDVRWLLFGGCQVEVEENKWIPIENYRYFEQE